MLDDGGDDDSSAVTRPIPFVEFKRRICEQMVGPYLKDRTRRLNSNNQTFSEQDEEGMHVGRQNEHILLENKYIKGDNRVSCHLCTLLGKGISRSLDRHWVIDPCFISPFNVNSAKLESLCSKSLDDK